MSSDELYENMVFSALRKQNLLRAIDAIKSRGPRGMDLWVKFKDEFHQDPRLLIAWILKDDEPVLERHIDEIDKWAWGVKRRGFCDRGTGKAPGAKFRLERGTGGVGVRGNVNHDDSPPPEQRKYYRHP